MASRPAKGKRAPDGTPHFCGLSSGRRVQPIERGFSRPQSPLPVLKIEAGQHLMPIAIRRPDFDRTRPNVKPPKRLPQTQPHTHGYNLNSTLRRNYRADGTMPPAGNTLLLFEHPLEQFDLLSEVTVIFDHLFDLAH